MPTAPRIEPDYKWTYDVRVQPIDVSGILPSGILIGSVAVVALNASGVDDGTMLRGSAIRAGSKIVDVVYAAGTAQTYTVVVDINGNGQIGGQTWQQRVKFAVIVQA